ncbi:MAG TPA: 50S ribosomal protein L17 [Pyrinomonadaceae bacterium]|jgi:large subunit ribosomal protein L17|nr:50S ribosomal protein L17 [Pyrinomonadaceae bacterium]
MRHLKAHRKLGRTTEHRISMLRNLATSLINARDERIITTLPKAKELRPFIEKAITLSRHAKGLEGEQAAVQSVHLRRQAAGFFHAGNRQQSPSTGKRKQPRAPRTAGVAALKRLFNELGERFKDRPGGYTRIIKLGRRDGDNAELAIIELVDNPREREAAEAATKRAKSVTSGKKKSAKAGDGKEAEGGRRGGRKADKTFEKEETTNARGKGEASIAETKDSDKAGSGGRRSQKTESTAAEQETE